MAFSAFLTFLLIGLSYWISKKIEVPIESLNELAGRISESDFSIYPEVKTKDEVGQLTDSFIAMSKRLEQSIKKLKNEISERTQAEAALKKSESILQATGQIAKVGGWEMDAITLEVNWTEETYRIHEVPLGVKPSLEEVINFYHPDERKRLTKAIERALEHGKSYDLEIRFITAKGKSLWIHTTCKPILVDGKIVKLTGMFQDITQLKLAKLELEKQRDLLEEKVSERTLELKKTNETHQKDIIHREQAEEALRKVTERLSLATNSAKVGIWDWDVRKNELIWDNIMYKLYGVKKKDFTGAYEAWSQGLHPEDKEKSEREVQMALSGEKVFLYAIASH